MPSKISKKIVKFVASNYLPEAEVKQFLDSEHRHLPAD